MGRPMSPCKDCTGRFRACHDVCVQYKLWYAVIHEAAAHEKERSIMALRAHGGSRKAPGEGNQRAVQARTKW